MRQRGTGSIHKDLIQRGPNHSGSGGAITTYRFSITIDGIKYRDYISRIVAMYLLGEYFVRSNDIRQIHHIDRDHSNWKPSNLVVAKNQKQHVQLDLLSRMEKLTGEPVTLRLKGAIYLVDYIQDDKFDVEDAFSWWIEQVT